MIDGTVCIFDPSVLLSSSETSNGNNDDASAAVVSTPIKHKGGAVSAMTFSPHNPLELATGGSDGEVIITDLGDPKNPVITRINANDTKQGGEIYSAPSTFIFSQNPFTCHAYTPPSYVFCAALLELSSASHSSLLLW